MFKILILIEKKKKKEKFRKLLYFFKFSKILMFSSSLISNIFLENFRKFSKFTLL